MNSQIQKLKNANMKVTKQPKNIFLKPSTESVLETHAGGLKTKNFKMGTVFHHNDKAPPPNFKCKVRRHNH